MESGGIQSMELQKSQHNLMIKQQQLIYTVVLLSGVQKNVSDTHTHTHTHIYIVVQLLSHV